MTKQTASAAVSAILCANALLAQKPVITSIVNAASYAAPQPSLPTIEPGSIVTIFGMNLAGGTAAATGTPLPTSLAGTLVMVDGVAAPLFYVSAVQINFQVSWRLRTNPAVMVASGSGTSDPFSLQIIGGGGPGIFTADGTGCGQAAALNVAEDGSVSPNGPANSAAPGGIVTFFVLGPYSTVTSPPPDGSPSPADPLFKASPQLFLGIGDTAPNNVFEGLAPGLVGVFQINVRLAPETPEGCAVPVVLYGNFDTSQIASISVHAGGGQCVDPPSQPVLTGSIEWRKTVATGITPPPPAESFSADFENIKLPGFIGPSASGDNTLLSLFPSNCQCYLNGLPVSRQCPQFTNTPLDAGVLALQTANGNKMNVFRAQTAPGPQYQAELLSGTLHTGVFTVSGSGAADVGPFTSALTLPAYPPISITTNLAPGSIFPYGSSFSVNWTGGGAGETVHLQVLSKSGYCECTAPANYGIVTLPALVYPSFLRIVHLPVPIAGQSEVRVFVQSEGAQVQSFTASGLTSTQHRWVYEWRFGNINFLSSAP